MVAIFLLDLVSIMKLLQLLNLKLSFNQLQWLWSSNHKWCQPSGYCLTSSFRLAIMGGFVIPTGRFPKTPYPISTSWKSIEEVPLINMDPFRLH